MTAIHAAGDCLFGQLLHNLPHLKDAPRCVQHFPKELKFIHAVELDLVGNPTSARFVDQSSQENSDAISSVESVTTGVPARLAANRNSTRPMPQRRPALPEDTRPNSNSFKASRKRASAANRSGGSVGIGQVSVGISS